MSHEKVAIIGASPKPDRYAYMANSLLKEYGHETFLVHPGLKEIDGETVYRSPAEIKQNGFQIDTVTMYVNKNISAALQNELLELKPRRVIFNPGAENAELFRELEQAGISALNACTLVLLRTGQY